MQLGSPPQGSVSVENCGRYRKRPLGDSETASPLRKRTSRSSGNLAMTPYGAVLSTARVSEPVAMM